jgi:CBS domain-containing protein
VTFAPASEVARIAPDADLATVARALTDAEVGALVVGEDEVLGVVSERDLVRALATGRAPATTAADIASAKVVWCDATASVAEVAAEMMDAYVRHVLVEDEGRLVGIVSARDLLGSYAAAALSGDD